MSKPRKAAVKTRAPRKPVARPAPLAAPQAVIEAPLARYAALISDTVSRRMIVGIRNDGGIDRGEAFTTVNKAAHQFWDAFARYCQASGIFPPAAR